MKEIIKLNRNEFQYSYIPVSLDILCILKAIDFYK